MYFKDLKNDRKYIFRELLPWLPKFIFTIGKINKMKTFKDKNPLNASLDKATIERFINQQTLLIELLSQSKKVNLNKIKIPTSISNLIKLKLGDVFQFYINHILRHLAQIEKIQNEADIILLDDAFQHRSVRASINILLTPFNDLYSNDLVVPAGNLREFRSGAKRADIIVVTKCPEGVAYSTLQNIQLKIKLGDHQKLYFSKIGKNEL